VNVGGLHPRSTDLHGSRMTGFGIEVLLEIGSVNRTIGPAVRSDSVVLTWTEMQVVTNADGVDTVHTYHVRPVEARAPTERIWTFELGLGYGQTSGFSSRVDTLDLRGSVRDLPTVSLYASYERTGTYLGLRSGFMRTQSLIGYLPEGRPWFGDADSFMTGVALGQVIDLLNLSIFVEAGYAARPFPSVRWSGGAMYMGPIPDALPRQLSLHGWTLGGGVQFSLGNQ
jgi:hypothetical protein